MEAGRDLDEIIRWTWDLEHTDWAVSTDYRDAAKFMEYTGRMGVEWSIFLNYRWDSAGPYYLVKRNPDPFYWMITGYWTAYSYSLPHAIALAAMRVPNSKYV